VCAGVCHRRGCAQRRQRAEGASAVAVLPREIAERAAGDERAPNAPVRRYLAAALKDARPLGRLGSALVSGQLLVCVLAAHEQRAAIADGSDMQPRAAQQYGLRDEP